MRRALASLITLAGLAVPLFFVSAPPDEGTSFSGDESVVDMAVFMIFAPLVAMTFIALCTLLFSALVSAIFRRDQVFDTGTGEFARRKSTDDKQLAAQ